MTEFPCCPSTTEWWRRTAVPRSWALQTWTEMAKYGAGANPMLEGSAKPREHDTYVLECCLAGDEPAVFKWYIRTRARWLGQLCDEAGAHPTKETLNRMLPNTSISHDAAGAETANCT